MAARTGSKNIQAKLVLLGDMGTGKTSLVLRFVKGQFYEYQESTIGAAFFTQVISLNEATIKFDIWDTAGQERYHSLAPMYYRGAAAAVVVYDLTSMESFVRAKKWVLELQRQGNPKMVMFLVANKADLQDKRKVSAEEGEQYARENGLSFLEASAKTAQNVNELFYEIGWRKRNLQDNLDLDYTIDKNEEEGSAVQHEDDDLSTSRAHLKHYAISEDVAVLVDVQKSC